MSAKAPTPPATEITYPVGQILAAQRPQLEPIEGSLRRAARWTRSLGYTAPPANLSVPQRALVGRAFEWWLRGWCVANRGAHERETVLHRALEEAKTSAPSVALVLSAALRDREQHLLRDVDSPASLANCMMLSRLEGAVRSGAFPDDPGALAEADLRHLTTLSRPLVLPLGRYSLEPRFALGPIKGDGDLSIDGLLVDVKATAAREPLLAWTQVVSYIVLDLLSKKPRWDRVGIYSARYAAFGVIDLARIGDDLGALGRFWKAAQQRTHGTKVGA